MDSGQKLWKRAKQVIPGNNYGFDGIGLAELI